MQGVDAQQVQLFVAELSKVESDDDRSLAVDGCRQQMAILCIVCHPGISAS